MCEDLKNLGDSKSGLPERISVSICFSTIFIQTNCRTTFLYGEFNKRKPQGQSDKRVEGKEKRVVLDWLFVFVAQSRKNLNWSVLGR